MDRELIYTLSESRVVFWDWKDYYNKQGPHRSLGLLTPSAFATEQIKVPSRSGRPMGSLRRKEPNNNINPENPVENLSLEPGSIVGSKHRSLSEMSFASTGYLSPSSQSDERFEHKLLCCKER